MSSCFILFDADRTLFDFDRSEEEAFAETAERYGLDGVALYPRYQAVNDRLWQLHEQGKIQKDVLRLQRYEELFEEQQLDIDPACFNRDYTELLSTKSILFEDSLEVCRKLSESYPLLLATNGTACVQRERFARSPIRRYFRKTYISEQVGYTKPDPRFFERIFAEQGIKDPARALMVGDSLRADIAGANAVGMRSCWFNPDRLENDSGIQPDCTIFRLDELLKNTQAFFV